MLAGLLVNEEGLTTVEYALLLALVLMAGILTWSAFGAQLRESPIGVGRATEAFGSVTGVH